MRKVEGLSSVEKQRGQGGLLGHFSEAQRAKSRAATRMHVLTSPLSSNVIEFEEATNNNSPNRANHKLSSTRIGDSKG
jgi:hypothetical protein